MYVCGVRKRMNPTDAMRVTRRGGEGARGGCLCDVCIVEEGNIGAYTSAV